MPARLYQERIGTGAQTMLLTHGIYGAGANLRTIARKVTEQRPEWSIVLVDLRGHGRSEAGESPHTLAACAEDVRAIVDEHGISVLAGHSFGGKVVLAARALAPRGVRQTWMLDSTPGARPHASADPKNTVTQVMGLMERMPARWARREDFVAAVVQAGQAAPIAQWLAMNLVADGDQLKLRLDLGAIREMLADYYARDLWPGAFDASLPGSVEIVIAERASTFGPEDRERLAHPPSHVHVHRIDAGHWLHIEAPAAVVDLIAKSLP